MFMIKSHQEGDSRSNANTRRGDIFSGFRWVAYFEIDGVMIENEVSGFEYDTELALVSNLIMTKLFHNKKLLTFQRPLPILHELSTMFFPLRRFVYIDNPHIYHRLKLIFRVTCSTLL